MHLCKLHSLLTGLSRVERECVSEKLWCCVGGEYNKKADISSGGANARNISFETQYGDQFTLSTQLIKPKLSKSLRRDGLLLPGQDSAFRGLGSNKLLFFKGNSLSQGFAPEVFLRFCA